MIGRGVGGGTGARLEKFEAALKSRSYMILRYVPFASASSFAKHFHRGRLSMARDLFVGRRSYSLYSYICMPM